MKKEITVFAPNRPGQLAGITETLLKEGVNVEDFTVRSIGDDGALVLNVDDCDLALRALSDAGYHAVSEETLLIRLEDKPGALATVAARLRDAGLDVRSMHIIRRDGTTSIASLVSDDQPRAAEVLSDLTIR